LLTGLVWLFVRRFGHFRGHAGLLLCMECGRIFFAGTGLFRFGFGALVIRPRQRG